MLVAPGLFSSRVDWVFIGLGAVCVRAATMRVASARGREVRSSVAEMVVLATWPVTVTTFGSDAAISGRPRTRYAAYGFPRTPKGSAS